ncbi:hypothetical protein [Archangium lansingense]|uniref:Uncharacterized protein n=1 Tax=Archangium lansingense TaxID=2995310 RepID=A0ABT4ABR7_9BACT|nr:hypothetical protein [Archangium lansinium]MCY1079128.1 hypothetical protein [Archangium lansinium]
MASRDIWSHGSGRQLPDLLGSALMALLLRTDDARPAYFCSPWITNFTVARNAFRDFEFLLPDLSDQEAISFADYLVHLARSRPVRMVSTAQAVSLAFLQSPGLRSSGVEHRLAGDGFHEKGILAPGFYLEGSMNLTHNGVYVNGEKVTYHAESDSDGEGRIARAYLEFNRRWELLERQ